MLGSWNKTWVKMDEMAIDFAMSNLDGEQIDENG